MGRWKLSLYSKSFAVLRAMRRNIVGTKFFENQSTAGWPPTSGQTHALLPAHITHQRLHNTHRTRYSRPQASVVNPNLDRKYGLLIQMQADKNNYAKNDEKTLFFETDVLP
jgi:hypothetical protein